MTTLIVGASGATGKHLVEQLLNRGQRVKVIIRSSASIPESWSSHEKLSIIKANITEIRMGELENYMKDCDAIASCLGHNITWKGLFGKPRRLVSDSIRSLCEAVENNSPKKPVKVVLMNTAGNRNRDLNERISAGQKIAMRLLRLLLPPYPDNEAAAEYLRTNIGQGSPVTEWVVVRPDNLINQNKVTSYKLFVSPTRSAIFNPGKTSRISVAHFMARLITENDLWKEWKGQMPVIYNEQAHGN